MPKMPWEMDYSPDGQPVEGGLGRPIIRRTPQASPQTPEQRDSTVVGTKGQDIRNDISSYERDTKPTYDREQAIGRWTDNVRNDKRIGTYEQALPVWADAIHARGSISDDNYLVNAMAKIADPTTGVNTKESDAMEQGQPAWQQFKAGLLKQYGSDGAGNFTEEARAKMRKTVTGRMKMLAETYNGARDEWRQRIKAVNIPGTDPDVILGPHMGKRFQRFEADYKGAPVHNLDGSIGAMPSNFNLGQLPGSRTLPPQGPLGAIDVTDDSPRQPDQTSDSHYISQFMGGAGNIAAGLGKGLGQIVDPLANVLGPVGSLPTRAMAYGADQLGFNGAADFLNKSADVLSNPFQLAPKMEQMSPTPQDWPNWLSRKGAELVGNSIAMPQSMLERAAMGIAGSSAVPAAFSTKAAKAAQGLPPLVDPITGRVNQVLESANPAQRMAAAKNFGIDLPLGSAGDKTASIIEKGLDRLPASAGVMNDVRRGIGDQLTNAVDNVSGQYGTGKSLVNAGNAAQAGAKNWISRFEEVSGKAYRAIPISDKASATVGNTKAVLGQLTSKFQSNPGLAAAFQNPRLTKYADALKGGKLSWRDLQDFRSQIGYEIGAERFSDSPTRTDLRALYGALSEDMRATAAQKGPGALRAFERANNLYREGQGRIDQALTAILGDDAMKNPEAAAGAIQKIMMSGKGSPDIKQLQQIRASLVKGGEWGDVASSMIHLMGQPVKSAGREFNPQTFVQNYTDMSEQARNLLFADRGRGELRKALDQFVTVNQRLASSDALRNTSNTVPGILGAGAVMSASSAIAHLATDPISALTAAGGLIATGASNYGVAKLWTNPSFVRWATGYSRAASAGAKPQVIQNQVKRLSQVAAANPAIREEVQAFGQAILRGLNDNAPRATSAVASDGSQDDYNNR